MSITKRLKGNGSELFNFTADSYLERTSRPIYAIVFLLPFIAVYEIGTVFIKSGVLNETQIRVVSFVWIRNGLEYLGLTSKGAWLACPLAIILILLGLQITSGKSWKVKFSDIWPMGLECALLSVPLIVLSLFLSSPRMQQQTQMPTVTGERVICCSAVDEQVGGEAPQVVPSPKPGIATKIITGIGAGIYEELVFRLIMICGLMLLFENLMRLDKRMAIVLAVCVSAALFSAHHHIDLLTGQLNQSDPFELTKFVFRTLAGAYFAVLFVIRGFGVTAGTHAFYDIIAVGVNALFFSS